MTQPAAISLLMPPTREPAAGTPESGVPDSSGFVQLLSRLQGLLGAMPDVTTRSPGAGLNPASFDPSRPNRLTAALETTETTDLPPPLDEGERHALTVLLQDLQALLQQLPPQAPLSAVPDGQGTVSVPGTVVQGHGPTPYRSPLLTGAGGPQTTLPEVPAVADGPSNAASLTPGSGTAFSGAPETLAETPFEALLTPEAGHDRVSPGLLRDRSATISGRPDALEDGALQVTPPPFGTATARQGTAPDATASTVRLMPLEPPAAASGPPPRPGHAVVLQIHPPELGQVHIHVHLTDAQLTAAFWADTPEVRALLQAHFSSLNQSLQTHGFQHHDIALSLTADGFAGQTGQFAQQQAPPHPDSRDPTRRTLALHGALSVQDARSFQTLSTTRLVDVIV